MSEYADRRLRAQISIFVTGRGISAIGDFIYLVALNIAVLQTTHSAAAVAGIWVVPMIATAVTSGWCGSVTDRLNKKTVLIVADLARAVFVALIPITSALGGIYVWIFLANMAGAFFRAAALPYRTHLVPGPWRKQVNGLVGMLQNGSVVIGPAIAGVLLVHGSEHFAIWLDAVSYALSAVSFLALPSVKAEASKVRANLHTLRTDWREAFQYLRGEVWFVWVYGLFALMLMVGMGADSQEVVFVERALGQSSAGYSELVMLAGVGYVVGALVVLLFAKRMSIRLLLGFCIWSGLCGLGYGLSHSFWQAGAALVGLGLFQSFASAGFSTYQQNALPPSHMGRILNVLTPLQQAGTIAAILAAGFTADGAGIRAMMVGAQGLFLCAGIALALLLFTTATVKRHLHAVETETVRM